MTLRERLRTRCPEASGRSVKQWLRTGRVWVNGRVVRDGRRVVTPADTVSLGPPVAPFPPALGRVYEDRDLLVIDKPAGLLTVATEHERGRTVSRLLRDYLASQRPPRRPFVVHRLDRDTSGLLVFAKTAAAKQHLQSQFQARTAERVYVAVVAGRVRADQGRLESRLVQGPTLRVRAVPGRVGVAARARPAITRYRVLARRRDSTLLELTLETGRRQQLRAQLAELGHPIVGDVVHGGPPGPRLHLHATRLGFVHPTTGRPLRFDSAPPAAWRSPSSGNVTLTRAPLAPARG
jgi:23S rRNA pseudouridine1911/1915/1917 synthase